jgi:hypothetical protein
LTEQNQIPLRPGEAILWQGSPVPGFHRLGQVIFLMIFGLPFLAIGVSLFFYGLSQFPKAGTLSDAGLALFVSVFGLPFAGFGAFLVFGPVIEARSNARDIRYTLTNRAAYIAKAGRFPSLKVYPILPHTALELEPGKRASTVWVHTRIERDSDGDLGTTKAGFENIAEADRVFGMILDLQGKAE